MILKLIETNATPKVGDLVWDTDMKKCHILDGLKLKVIISKNCGYYKLVKPYGISDEDIKGGFFLDTTTQYKGVYEFMEYGLTGNAKGYIIDTQGGLHNPKYCFNLAILPEQFNYQDIVDLGLKDGDEFDVKPRKPNGVNIWLPLSITKPLPVTYTEEEVYALCKKVYWLSDLSEGAFDSWFNIYKKK
jgi:hypothetical protein